MKKTKSGQSVIIPFTSCPNGHPDLQWSPLIKSASLCSMCSKPKAPECLKWECKSCKQKYCISCIKPNISNSQCPMSHAFEEAKTDESSICNICESAINDGKVYRDSVCKLELCEPCLEINEFSSYFFDMTKIDDNDMVKPYFPLPFDPFDFNPKSYQVILIDEGTAMKVKFFMNMHSSIINIKPSNPALKKILFKNYGSQAKEFKLIGNDSIRSFNAEIILKGYEFSLKNNNNPQKSEKYPIGVRLTRHKISDGDVIMIGIFFMRIMMNQETNTLKISFYIDKSSKEIIEDIEITDAKPHFIGLDYNAFMKKYGEQTCVSKKHAKIIYENNDYMIEDCKSQYGLYLIIPPNKDAKIFSTQIIGDKAENLILLASQPYKIKTKILHEVETIPLCDKGHNLRWTEGTIDLCSKCGEKKYEVYWICEICEKKYCFRCKPATLIDRKRCPVYHKCEKFDLKGKSSIKCSVCVNKINNNEGYKDDECNMSVCGKCLGK